MLTDGSCDMDDFTAFFSTIELPEVMRLLEAGKFITVRRQATTINPEGFLALQGDGGDILRRFSSITGYIRRFRRQHQVLGAPGSIHPVSHQELCRQYQAMQLVCAVDWLARAFYSERVGLAAMVQHVYNLTNHVGDEHETYSRMMVWKIVWMMLTCVQLAAPTDAEAVQVRRGGLAGICRLTREAARRCTLHSAEMFGWADGLVDTLTVTMLWQAPQLRSQLDLRLPSTFSCGLVWSLNPAAKKRPHRKRPRGAADVSAASLVPHAPIHV